MKQVLTREWTVDFLHGVRRLVVLVAALKILGVLENALWLTGVALLVFICVMVPVTVYGWLSTAWNRKNHHHPAAL